jgi:hypothetical protein
MIHILFVDSIVSSLPRYKLLGTCGLEDEINLPMSRNVLFIANITDTEVDAQELEAKAMQMAYHAGFLDLMEEAQDHCWRVLVRDLAP